MVDALEEAGIATSESSNKYLPNVEVDLDKEGAENILNLIENLEDNDDVQEVYANFNTSDEIIQQIAAEQ